MGRANFTRGNLFSDNLQSGAVSITTNGSGNGTATVTFKKKMKNAPKVVAILGENATTGVLACYTKSSTGFTVKVTGSSDTTTPTVDWIAYDDSFN